MDAPEQVRIFSQDVPIPPAYSETDPQPSSTQIFSIQNSMGQYQGQTAINQGQLQAVPAIQTLPEPAASSHATPRTLLQSGAFSPSPSGAYSNPGFLGHVLGDPDTTTAPPSYERELPPSYEEAVTASPI